MSNKDVDNKVQLISAINNCNLLKATSLCEQGVLASMDILELNNILSLATPKSLDDNKQPIFLLLMKQKEKLHEGLSIVFLTAHLRFVRKMLANKMLDAAKEWCALAGESYNKPFTNEQMLRVFGGFFNITNNGNQIDESPDFKDVADIALDFFLSQYDKPDVDIMFNVYIVQSLKEYKLSYIEYLLEKGIVFDPKNTNSCVTFYDSHFRKLNKYNGQPIETAKPLHEWLSYLHSMAIEHEGFMSFGYKVYFEGKDDCETPSDVLNKAPEWQRQYILPFLGSM